MIENIISLINLLDKDDDHLLIFLLEIKLNKHKEIIGRKISVTDKEVSNTKSRHKLPLAKKILQENSKYKKIEKILSRSDCDNCIFAVKHKEYGFVCGNDDDRCNRCIKRCEFLEDIKESIYNDAIFVSEQTMENNPDLMRYKTIINKLTRKYNKIKYNY